MFSSEIVIGVFVALVLVFFAIYFMISKKSETLKKQRKVAFILIAVVFVGLYFFMVNHVYILTNGGGGYEEKVLFFPSKFTLANKQEVSLKPKFGVYSIVINNTQRDAVFETVVYGSAKGRPDIELPAQSVTYVNSSTDYVLREPPNSVRIKGSGTTKGWIHY